MQRVHPAVVGRWTQAVVEMADGTTGGLEPIEGDGRPRGRCAYVASKVGSWVVDENRSVVFGRVGKPGVVGLDDTDTGLSRVGGRISLGESGVLVENLSKRRPVLVEYPTVVRQTRLAPASPPHVLAGDALVLVPGKIYTHSFAVRVPDELTLVTARVDVTSLPPDATELDAVVTVPDRELLAALAETYLARWPRHDPNPLSYEDAAVRLNVSTKAATRRLENLRARLAEHDVLHAEGTNAMRTVVEWAIDTGIVRIVDKPQGHPPGPQDLLRPTRSVE